MRLSISGPGVAYSHVAVIMPEYIKNIYTYQIDLYQMQFHPTTSIFASDHKKASPVEFHSRIFLSTLGNREGAGFVRPSIASPRIRAANSSR